MDKKVLLDKIIVSTRPEGRSKELLDLLHQHGAQLVELPMIEIVPHPLNEHERNAIAQSNKFDWIVFTSVNAVKYYYREWERLNGATGLPSHLKIACIGKKTAESVEDRGGQVTYINKGNTSLELREELLQLFANTHPNILFPCGNLAGNKLTEYLQETAVFERILVYTTVLPNQVNHEKLDLIKKGNYDLILFTSPSGFDNFIELTEYHKNNFKMKILSIGASTTESIQKHGVIPLITAAKSTPEGLVRAMINYYTIRE